MTIQEVKPLFDDPLASPELRNFVTLARGDGPSQAELERLAARLGPAVGVSAGVLLTGTAVGAGALGTPPGDLVLQPGTAAKWGGFGKLFSSAGAKLLAVGLSVGVGVGIWLYRGSDQPAPRSPALAVQDAPPSELAAAPGGGSRPVERFVAPDPSADAPPTFDAPAVEVPERAAAEASVRARPARAARGASGRAARRRVQDAEASVAGAVTPEPATEPAAAPAADAPSELSLIRQAQAARGRAGEALALLATHERLYPRGALAQEREVLAIELLLKSGKLAQARARAGRFEREHASSAHLPRVRALIERADAE